MTYHHCDSVSFFPLKEKHPNPRQKYYGLKTTAFVPFNHKGKKLYRLLEVAFKYKLLFTVATTSTGEERVTFSDIPLKTKESGGHDRWGLCKIRCLMIMQLVAFFSRSFTSIIFSLSASATLTRCIWKQWRRSWIRKGSNEKESWTMNNIPA